MKYLLVFFWLGSGGPVLVMERFPTMADCVAGAGEIKAVIEATAVDIVRWRCSKAAR